MDSNSYKQYSVTSAFFILFKGYKTFVEHDCQKYFESFCNSLPRKRVTKIGVISLNRLKKKSLRIDSSLSWYSRRVWFMTRLIHDNQHLQHLKYHKKQSETRKQVRK